MSIGDDTRESSAAFDEAVERFLDLLRSQEPADARDFAAEHAHLGPAFLQALLAIEALELVRAHDAGGRRDAQMGILGQFRLVREVGRGGMGIVFEAIEEPLGRRVALKVLPAELLSSASARARFRREAELASRLDHSGICTVYGAGVDGDRPWIAMRFVAGNTLASMITTAREAGEFDIALSGADRDARSRAIAVAGCLARIARALHVAHEHGVVHRDVKPANVMIDAEGAPVLLDFGLALEEESDAPSLTRTGETAGTPAYIPPEQISGDVPRLDAQGDVYSLGVTLYECLTLRRPFDSPTRAGLYHAIADGAVRDVRADNRSIPRDLAVVVATAIERDRARRYATAADLAADLEAVVARRPIAARPVPAFGRVMRWMRREPKQALLAGSLSVAVIGLAIAGGIVWASRDDVLAAERVEHENALESALETGFFELGFGDVARADAAFARAFSMEPTNVEVLAGRALASLRVHDRAEALRRLEHAPRNLAFDQLRSMAGARIEPYTDSFERLAKASPVEFFLEGTAHLTHARVGPAAERLKLSRTALDRLNEACMRSPKARAVYFHARLNAAIEAGDSGAMRSAATAVAQLWPDSFQAHAAAGFALYRIDPSAGRAELERSIELEPSWSPTWRSLANACLALKDWEGAERAVWRAVELDRSDAASWGTLGTVFLRRECMEDAVHAMRRAADLDPMRIEVLANLGMLELQLGHDAAAEEHLRRAIAIDWAYHGVVHESLGIILLDRRAHEESRAEFEAALALRPSSLRALEGLGAALVELDQPAEGLAVFDAVLEKKKPDAGLLLNISIAFAKLDRHVESYAALVQLERLDARYPRLSRMKGERLLALGDAGGAAIALGRALEEDAKDVVAWTGLGRASQALGDAGFALDCLGVALELDACHAEAAFALAQALVAGGSSRAAADSLARAMTIDPRRSKPGLAAVRERAGDREALERELARASHAKGGDELARALDAEKPETNEERLQRELAEARAAYERNPRDELAIVWLGRRLGYVQRFEEAVDVFTRGLEIHPDSAWLLRFRGHRYITLRRFDDAAQDLSRARDLAAKHPDIVEPDGAPNPAGVPIGTLRSNIDYHLGLAHFLRGDFAKAWEAFELGFERARANDDRLVSHTYWSWITLRKLGRAGDAAKLLEPIEKDMRILENDGYLILLRHFRGDIGADEVMKGLERGKTEYATRSFGAGMKLLFDGDRKGARASLERAVDSGPKAAFGCIAAEVELVRMKP